jgi:microcystin-dependent protein
MNNLANLEHMVSGINYLVLPYIQETLFNMSFHVGEYKYSVRTADFNGWLMCDGRSLSRETHKDLYAVIGTTFGSADSESFKLPDFRGRALAMMGAGSNLTSRALGASVGAETHTLVATEMPSHTHAGTTDASGAHAHALTDPGHTHTQTTFNDDYNMTSGTPPAFGKDADSTTTVTFNNIGSSTTGVTVQTNGSHEHTFTTGSAGSGNAHNNMQPTMFGGNVFMYCGLLPIPV